MSTHSPSTRHPTLPSRLLQPTRGDGPDGPEFPPTNNSTIVVPEEIVETPVDTTEAPVDTTATPPEEVVAEPAATETEA